MMRTTEDLLNPNEDYFGFTTCLDNDVALKVKSEIDKNVDYIIKNNIDDEFYDDVIYPAIRHLMTHYIWDEKFTPEYLYNEYKKKDKLKKECQKNVLNIDKYAEFTAIFCEELNGIYFDGTADTEKDKRD